MDWPLLKLFGKAMQHIIFTLIFIPVIPTILTRNKRYCSWFRNSMSLACWS